MTKPQIELLPVPETEQFSQVCEEILAKVAGALGISYEQLAGDLESPAVSWSREIFRQWQEQKRMRGFINTHLGDPRKYDEQA